MTQRFLAAAYSRRKAPTVYDPSWLNAELARLAKSITSYVIRNVTVNTQLQINDGMVICDATLGPITITLPLPPNGSGQPVTLKKSDASANAITLAGTIDGVLNRQLLAKDDSIIIQSDGVTWFRPTLTIPYPLSTTYALTAGTHLAMTPSGTFNGGVARTLSTDGTDVNTASTLVARGTDGSFAAGTVTASGLLSIYSGTPNINLLEYTQQWDASAWVKTTLTVTANSFLAPDGTTTADTILATGGVNQYQQYFTIPSNSQVVMSVYIKRLTTTNQTNIGIYDVTAGSLLNESTFQWTADDITGYANVGGTSGATRAASNEGNGWWRVSAITNATLDSTHTYYFFGYPRNSGNPGSIYIWGAQVELGAALSAYRANTALRTMLSVTGLSDLIGNTTITGTLAVSGKVGVNGAGVSTTTALNLTLGSTSASSLRIPPGAAPTSRVSGDVWGDTKGLYYHAVTTTVGPLIDSGPVFLLMGA